MWDHVPCVPSDEDSEEARGLAESGHTAVDPPKLPRGAGVGAVPCHVH